MAITRTEKLVYLGIGLAVAAVVGVAVREHIQSRDPSHVLAKVKETLGVTSANVSYADMSTSYLLSSDARYFAGTIKQDPDASPISAVIDLKQKRVVWRLDGLSATNITFNPKLQYVAFMVSSEKFDVLLAAPLIVETSSGKALDFQPIIFPENLGMIGLNWKSETELVYEVSGGPVSERCLVEVTQTVGTCELHDMERGQRRKTPFRIQSTTVAKIERSFLELQKRVPQTQTAKNESSAVGILRTINTSLITYASTYPAVGFPRSLTYLGGSAGDCAAAGLLDPTIASNIFERNGYKFEYSLSIEDQEARRGSCPPETATAGGDYIILASPTMPGRTGSRYFVTDSSAVIYVGATRDEAVSRQRPL